MKKNYIKIFFEFLYHFLYRHFFWLSEDLIGFKQTNFSSKKTPWQLTAIFTFRGV